MNDNIKCLQGDLISRAALKQEILPLLSLEEKIVIESKIDNAQGYEQEVYLDETSFNHYIEGYKEARRFFERPKGKWIDNMTDKGYVECPFCHKQISGGDLNFCVKCGADMRGKEDEVQNESQ